MLWDTVALSMFTACTVVYSWNWGAGERPLHAQTDEKTEKKADNKSKEINLLDPKVLQNVGIALAKYRMQSAEIKQAVLELDEQKLDLEKVSSLHSHAPTPD